MALSFVFEADQCLLRFHPLHSLHLRLLFERSRALRGLAHLDAKTAAESSRPAVKVRGLKRIIERLVKLAALEVEQMASICAEISKTRKAWTGREGAPKWDGIAAYTYHRRKTAAALRDL